MSTWGGVEHAYATSFATLCAGTSDAILDSLEGEPFLDVGCGTGTVALAARQRGMRVAAVDSDLGMVSHANRLLPGVCSVQALPRLAFRDEVFKSVAANFVVNHLPDPRAGVRDLARVLAPGGRLAMTIWPAAGAGWTPLVQSSFDAAAATPAPPSRLPAELDFPRTPGGLAGLATESGLKILTQRTLRWEWAIQPANLWAGIKGGVAGPGARYLMQSPPIQAHIEQAFFTRAEGMCTDGVLHFTCEAAFVVAQA